MTDDGHVPALQAEGLAKTFGGVRALKGVDLTIQHGEVQALLGENGSGKSTFIKILSGYHVPDEGGRVAIDGAEVTFGSAESAYTHGCRFVHQDLGLVGTSSVLDNILLNAGFPSRFGTIKGREAMRSVREDLARVGLEQVDPRTPVAALTPALKTGVAVARALRTDVHHPARLVVLDEPTATLPENEVRHLLEIVRRVAETGVGVLYVTHRLDEVFEVADNVTVFRDGVRVATQPTSTLNRRSLINLLIGSELDEIHAESEHLHSEHGEPDPPRHRSRGRPDRRCVAPGPAGRRAGDRRHHRLRPGDPALGHLRRAAARGRHHHRQRQGAAAAAAGPGHDAGPRLPPA